MPDETKLNAAIDAAAATAIGSETEGELGRERSLALEAYQGANLEPNEEGRSQVVDWTVFETVQWILPSLTRIFANGDNIVEFDPTGPDDEDAAEQESDYLNYLVTQKNNWFLTLLTWFQDALITKNAYCWAFMEEKLNPETVSYIGQSEESLALLLDDDAVEVVGGRSYPDPEDEGEVVQDPATGLPVQMPPRTLYDVQIRRTKPTKKLQFRVIPPERVKVGDDTPDFTTERCNFLEIFEDITISDLRAQGYDVADDIADDGEHTSQEEEARNRYDETFDRSSFPDPSTRVVRARTIWIRFDYDEDGIAELQEVVRVGREILNRKEVSRIPVSCIVPFLNTHRHMGNSVADLTFDLQRIKTALLRGGLDSLYLSQNPGHAVSNRVNLDDMLVSRPGRVVRMMDDSIPAEGHILPLVTEFTLPQTLEGLRHMDTMVESRVGVNKMFQGIDQTAMADNAYNAVGQLSTMAAQRVEQIARLFANGVEYLFSLAHELVIKSGHQSETVKLRGQWVTIDPSQWRTGRDMRVVAPFAAGNKDTLVARLLTIAQLQEKALAGGLPIVDANDAYNTAIELTKASDFPAPEKFWTDPSTVPPQEPPPDYTLMALEIENKKADNSAQDSQVDAEVAKYKADLDAEMDKYRADLDAEIKLALAQMEAGGKVDLERLKAALRPEGADLNGSVRELQKATESGSKEQSKALQRVVSELAKAVKAMSAPKEIIRDKDGKVIGARPTNGGG